MKKLQHRQVNIDAQLVTVRHTAEQLRAIGVAPALVDVVATRLGSNAGPTPLVELFNWAQKNAAMGPTVEQLRDDLFELLRIFCRIRRHCTQVTVHPDRAVESLDRFAIASRLDIIVARILLESARVCAAPLAEHRLTELSQKLRRAVSNALHLLRKAAE